MIDKGEWDEDHEFPDELEELPEEILPILKNVSELAYRGLVTKEVQLIFTARDVGKDFNHLGLLSESREMYVTKGARVSYSFFHLSIQEFLAAWHASRESELIKYAKINFFDKLNKSYLNRSVLPAHVNAFVRFLAGFVGLSKLLTQPVDKECSIILLHCFFEAQNPLDFKVDSYNVSVGNPLDGYVCGYAITHAPIDLNLAISFADF